jgi:antitoxin VapB
MIYIPKEVSMTRTAKLFRNGRSQAVRLPSDYRFEGSEVFVRRDPATGDVILSRRPESWEDYFELVRDIDVPSDFLAERYDMAPQKRRLF